MHLRDYYYKSDSILAQNEAIPTNLPLYPVSPLTQETPADQITLDQAPLRVFPADTRTQSLGQLRANVISAIRNLPVENATITISYTGDPDSVVEEIKTDRTGQTMAIDLLAPPLDYSLEPNANQPYSEYTLKIQAHGFEPIIISGCEILPTVTALQNVTLDPLPDAAPGTAELYVIPAHTLYGDYPPPIIEEEVKPVNETGEIVLSRVVIPEYVVVHDGVPQSSAKDYYVRYRDYVKNVASSEIYATWPEATIFANILAIQSFTLNRVYTEWYRNPYFLGSKIHPD